MPILNFRAYSRPFICSLMKGKVKSFSTHTWSSFTKGSARYSYSSYSTCYCFANLHFNTVCYQRANVKIFSCPSEAAQCGEPLEDKESHQNKSDHHTIRCSCCGLWGTAWGVEDLLIAQALLCGRVWYINSRWNWSSWVRCTALWCTCNRRSPTRNKSYSFFLQLLQVVFYYFFSLQKGKCISATETTHLDTEQIRLKNPWSGQASSRLFHLKIQTYTHMLP